MGRFGESVAVRFLTRRGVVIEGRNVRSGRSELDILARCDGMLVAFEVKTVVVRHPADDGVHAVSSAKLSAVRRGLRRLGPGAGRVDVITVAIGGDGVSIRWIRDARW